MLEQPLGDSVSYHIFQKFGLFIVFVLQSDSLLQSLRINLVYIL